jgi:hypothetical protein
MQKVILLILLTIFSSSSYSSCEYGKMWNIEVGMKFSEAKKQFTDCKMVKGTMYICQADEKTSVFPSVSLLIFEKKVLMFTIGVREKTNIKDVVDPFITKFGPYTKIEKDKKTIRGVEMRRYIWEEKSCRIQVNTNQKEVYNIRFVSKDLELKRDSLSDSWTQKFKKHRKSLQKK